jgi:hypothetical protein
VVNEPEALLLAGAADAEQAAYRARRAGRRLPS